MLLKRAVVCYVIPRSVTVRNHNDFHHQTDGSVRRTGGICSVLPVTGGRVSLPAGLRLGWEFLHGHHRFPEAVRDDPNILDLFPRVLCLIFVPSLLGMCIRWTRCCSLTLIICTWALCRTLLVNWDSTAPSTPQSLSTKWARCSCTISIRWERPLRVHWWLGGDGD